MNPFLQVHHTRMNAELMIDMVDMLVEDIVEATETLTEADTVDIEALAHQHTKSSLTERLSSEEGWSGWGKWGKKKAEEFKAKMKQQEGEGIFKRGVC